MFLTKLQIGCGGALGMVLWGGTAVFGQGRPSMERKESPKREAPKESRPEPRKESRPEPRKESRPEPRREAPRQEPPRNLPRDGNREASGAGRPTFGGGNTDGGRRIVGNAQSQIQMQERAARDRLETERRHKDRVEQDRIEREREEREEAEFKEKLRLEQQRVAELLREIERLQVFDRDLADERRQELRGLERQQRELEDARQRARELDRLRRANQNVGGIVPAPRMHPVAPIKPARAAAAKPVKPVEPRPAPLTAEQLAVALNDLASGDLRQELAALAILAKAAADENRERVGKAIEPHLNKADPAKRKAAAKSLAVWASVEQVPQLLKLLPELDKAARHDAIATLGTLKDVRTIVPLVELLTVPVDRHAAVEALQAIGPEAVSHVAKKLAHDELWVRAAAVDILAKVGDAESKNLLQELAENDPEAFVRNKASKAVRQMGG